MNNACVLFVSIWSRRVERAEKVSRLANERIRFSRKPLSQCQVRAAAAAARPSTFCMHARPAQRARASARTSTAPLSHSPAHFARAKSLHPPLILQLARFLALSCLLLSPNNASRTACARADRLDDHSYDWWPARASAPRCSRRRWGSARASVADPHGHGTCWRCCRRRGRGRRRVRRGAG